MTDCWHWMLMAMARLMTARSFLATRQATTMVSLRLLQMTAAAMALLMQVMPFLTICLFGKTQILMALVKQMNCADWRMSGSRQSLWARRPPTTKWQATTFFGRAALRGLMEAQAWWLTHFLKPIRSIRLRLCPMISLSTRMYSSCRCLWA